MFDKLHEECGVFAIYGHRKPPTSPIWASTRLQHRGQESAGIVLQRRARGLLRTRAWATWPTSSRRSVLAELPGDLAIGHTRYSTTGDSVLLQRAAVFGGLQQGAASRWRTTATSPTRPNCGANSKPKDRSSRRTSDTEVILHLVARSRERTLAGRAARGAAAAGRRVFAGVPGAGPHHRGARSARIPAAGDGADGRRQRHVRVRVRDLRVRPDRRGVPERRGARRDGDRRPRGHDARALRAGRATWPTACSSTSTSRGPIRSCSAGPCRNRARMLGRLLARECPADADIVVPVPDSGVPAAIGYAVGSRSCRFATA